MNPPPFTVRVMMMIGVILTPVVSYAETIDLKLIQLNQDYDYCHFVFNVVNKTNFNITTVEPYVIFRERDGTVIASTNIGVLRLKPGKEAIADGIISFSHIDCSTIGSIEFKNFWGNMVEIDGNQDFGKNAVELADGVVVTSSVKQVQAR